MSKPEIKNTYNVQISVTKTTYGDDGKIKSISDPETGNYAITGASIEYLIDWSQAIATRTGKVVENAIQKLNAEIKKI